MYKLHINDPLERMIADLLNFRKIQFIHESQRPEQRLDFYLPDLEVYIEVKRFHTDWINNQLKLAPNIIVLQGEAAVNAFCKTAFGAGLTYST